MPANGPAVWGVAVCVGVGMCFCKVPINGWVFSSRRNCPDGKVPINDTNLSRHDKIVQIAMQKPWQRRVGQQPYWLCHGSKISHGTESLISGNNSDRIDLWCWLLSCPGCWRQLPIPSVLGAGVILKLSRLIKIDSFKWIYLAVLI